ncbi:hypothetical protein SAMD00023519_02176 [Listeria monocytogenes]|nr:hypothetical protein SAMD00023519_02176 [Listeria monocytogenes]
MNFLPENVRVNEARSGLLLLSCLITLLTISYGIFGVKVNCK